MKITPALLFLGCAIAVAPISAAEPDLSKLPPASEKTGVTYAKDIRPLFEASCFGCHGAQRQRGGLRLDSLEAALKGGKEGKVIEPGKGKESLLVQAVAQIDSETAMPPKRGGGGAGGRAPNAAGGADRRAGLGGGRGGGAGGAGVFGRQKLAQLMVSQGDKDGDQKLSKTEFSGLAEGWFGKMDADKTGKLSRADFSQRLGQVLNLPSGTSGAGGAGAASGGQGNGAGATGSVGTGLFAAADADKDGSLTQAELKGAFEKWFTEWDTEKAGGLDEEKLYAGLKVLLPQQGMGGFAGQGGGGGRGQGGQGGGGAGPAPKPLTAEQVGLVRAWVDQGAK